MSKKEKVIIRDKKKVIYDPLTHHLLMEEYIKNQMRTYMWKFKETPIDLNSIRFKYRKDGSFVATGVKVFFETGKPLRKSKRAPYSSVWIYMKRGRKRLTEDDLEIVRGLANAFARMGNIEQVEVGPDHLPVMMPRGFRP